MKSIINNLRRAIAIVEAAPEESIDLETYRQDTECGTLFCAYGLLAQDAYFQGKGVILHPAPCGEWSRMGPNESLLHQLNKAAALFGPNAFYRLFAPYGAGRLDRTLTDNGKRAMSDKALVLARLRRQIESFGGEAE